MLMLESNHSDTAGSDRVTVISSMGLLDWTLMTELESSPIKTGGSVAFKPRNIDYVYVYINTYIYIHTTHPSTNSRFWGLWSCTANFGTLNYFAQSWSVQQNRHESPYHHTNHHTNHHKITRQQPCNDHIISQSHFSRCASHALNFCKNALPTRPLPILRCFALTLKDSPTWGMPSSQILKVRQLQYLRKHLRNRWPSSERELGWKSHSHLPWNHLPWNHILLGPGVWVSHLISKKQNNNNNNNITTTTTVQFLLVWNLETSLFVHPIFPCSWWMNNLPVSTKTPAKAAKDETTY